MQLCDLLLTTELEQVPVIRFVLDDGQVTAQALEPQYEKTAKEILNKKLPYNHAMVSSQDAPSAWFYALPKHFSGSYLRARMY